MKTKLAIAAVAMALTSASAFATLPNLGSGEITIKGLVKNSSCTVSFNGSDSPNGTITLPDVDKSDFKKDTMIGMVPFTVTVSNCDLVQSPKGQLHLKLDGNLASSSYARTNGLLKNDLVGDGAATHALVGILDSNKKTVVPGLRNHVVNFDHTQGGSVTIKYTAGYKSDSVNAITAGNVSSLLKYTLSYL